MLIDGRTIASQILASLLTRVDALAEKYGIAPHLAVIRVGDDPAITSYIKQKEKKAKEIGATVSVYNLSKNVTAEKIKECIKFLQEQTDIHGLILQLPVPKSINYEELIMDIHPDKDVDGFRPNSQFVIPVASAVMKILELVYVKELVKVKQGVTRLGTPLERLQSTKLMKPSERGKEGQDPEIMKIQNTTFNDWLSSKRIVVIGKGKTGGEPVIRLLRTKNIEPKIIDSNISDPSQITKTADIIISAVGKPGVLKSEMIKQDSVLIGIGMSMENEGKFIGDYDEEDIKNKASWYTPVPGGVGPVNVACLMENLVIAAENSVEN